MHRERLMPGRSSASKRNRFSSGIMLDHSDKLFLHHCFSIISLPRTWLPDASCCAASPMQSWRCAASPMLSWCCAASPVLSSRCFSLATNLMSWSESGPRRSRSSLGVWRSARSGRNLRRASYPKKERISRRAPTSLILAISVQCNQSNAVSSCVGASRW